MRHTLATLLAAAAFLHWPGLAAAQHADIQFRSDYIETRKEADKKGMPCHPLLHHRQLPLVRAAAARNLWRPRRGQGDE